MDVFDPVFVVQVKAARALLGWSQKELAEKAKLSLTVISRLERGDTQGSLSTLREIYLALKHSGVSFSNDDDGGFGVRVEPDTAQGIRARLKPGR